MIRNLVSLTHQTTQTNKEKNQMARLNKQVKSQIIENALIKAGVLDKQENINKLRADLAESVRVYACGGKEAIKLTEKLAEQIKLAEGKIPNGVCVAGNFQLRSAFSVPAAFGGMRTTLYYSGKTNDKDRVRKSPAPYQYGNSINFAADHKFTDQFKKIEKMQSDLDDLASSIRTNVSALVSSVNTDSQLIKAWPESKELLPEEISKPVVNLPSADVKSLNEMIGIPSEES